jgi:D-lactate dehydrogenase
MNIAFFEITEFEKEKFEKELVGHNLKFFKDTIQDISIEEYKDSDVLCVFIYSKVTAEILKQLPNIKTISTRSTGIDHIDSKYCSENNITIKNIPLYGENTVAEHTFALMLSLSRKIHKSYVRSTRGEFSTEGLQGFDLKDKTLGLIGGGRIGLHVARMAKSFGMHVRVYDIKQDEFLAEIINFKYETLEKLLEESDIISLHVPYNAHTHHLINKETLSHVKKGALLINTARGGLVDTDSLIEALENGTLSGAGLDVIEGEELLVEENVFLLPIENAAKVIQSSRKLLTNENVVMTPHNAFNSVEAITRIIEATIENITK